MKAAAPLAFVCALALTACASNPLASIAPESAISVAVQPGPRLFPAQTSEPDEEGVVITSTSHWSAGRSCTLENDNAAAFVAILRRATRYTPAQRSFGYGYDIQISVAGGSPVRAVTPTAPNESGPTPIFLNSRLYRVEHDDFARVLQLLHDAGCTS